MRRFWAVGLRPRIVLWLALVLTVFIVLTEFTITSLVRASFESVSSQIHPDGGARKLADKHQTEEIVAKLRKPVLFYMVTGAVIALGLGAFAVSRVVVRPLAKVTQAVESVADGKLDIRVPIEGSKEFIALGVNFNRMTQTIRRQQEKLETQLREIENSSVNLREAQDRLIRAAKLASVGTLAAGVAHEIGNPIAGVQGLLDAIDSEQIPEQRKAYRQLIRKEIKRVDKIIGELLAYARPARTMEQGEQCTHIQPVLEHVRGLLKAQKLFDRITLSIYADIDVPEVLIPAGDLTQLLINILLNAAQAMEGKGEIEIRIGVISNWRPHMAVVERHGVRIAICDDGPGISKEDQLKIFDPFYTNRKTGQGSGLGLAICQSICNRIGGEIIVDSAYTEGAKFIVTIPVG